MPRAKGPKGTLTVDPHLSRAVEVIGGKWTIEIISLLLSGTVRFGALQEGLGGISPKMLVARLRELEGEGLVTRTWFPEIPPRVEYALTAKGETLRSVIQALATWGEHDQGASA